MKEKLITIKVTEEEESLIMGMRNYVRSYPDGNPNLLYHLRQLFDILTDPYNK